MNKFIELKAYLIVIREGNNACADTQDHTWMNFTMSPDMSSWIDRCLNTLVQITTFVRTNLVTSLKLSGDVQIFRCHCNHDSLFFLGIQVLNHTVINQTLESIVSVSYFLILIHVCW